MARGQNQLTRQPAAFGPRTADRLYRMSQAYQFGQQLTSNAPVDMLAFMPWQGVLTENMDAPANYLTDPVEVEVELLVIDTDVTAPDEIKFKLEDNADRYLTCYNWNPYQVAVAGERVAGYWHLGQPVVLWPGVRVLYGVALEDIASLGIGDVSIVDDGGSGSGTGTGSGSGSGSGTGITLYDTQNEHCEDILSGDPVEVHPDVMNDRWVVKRLCPSGSGCVLIPGVNFDDLEADSDPEYALGISYEGCLVKIPISSCSTGTGTGTGSGS